MYYANAANKRPALCTTDGMPRPPHSVSPVKNNLFDKLIHHYLMACFSSIEQAIQALIPNPHAANQACQTLGVAVQQGLFCHLQSPATIAPNSIPHAANSMPSISPPVTSGCPSYYANATPAYAGPIAANARPYAPTMSHTSLPGTPLSRFTDADYSRMIGTATEALLPGAREISNAVSAQDRDTQNAKGLSDLFWIWGQFLDHDIDLLEESDTMSKIKVPKGDPHFDPRGTGTVTLDFNRSELDKNGNAINTITSLMDASNVYGSDEARTRELRSFEDGKLRMGADNLLPTDQEGMFEAGDVRANENAGLTSMHTIWAREHNRLAENIKAHNPGLSDEQIFQTARELVVAQQQSITFNEYLPNLLGRQNISAYRGYNPYVSSQIDAEFAGAAYRFGHSMVSSTIPRLDAYGQVIAEGNLSLREAFFNPNAIREAGIDPIIRGMGGQVAQALDPMIVDDLRNTLFGEPGSGGLDLAALNIHRGRDLSIPSYNDIRSSLGLARVESFDDPIFGQWGDELASVYSSPDQVDMWVGGLAEEKAAGAMVGETMQTIIASNFIRLRDSDPNWYQAKFSGHTLYALQSNTLADVIARNSEVDLNVAMIATANEFQYAGSSQSAPASQHS